HWVLPILANCIVTEAELWEILDGIEAINNIIQDGSSESSNSTLVKRILQVLNMFKQWKIQHLPREGNSIADSLAKSIRTRSLGLRLFEDHP
ncbi:hypothetical protein Gogos_017766, partial [Gossypium gossypioides]|nr:hypothetical protein [Gossypium gossypioides]